MLTILHEPAPLLRQVMEPVLDAAAPEIKQLVEDMVFTMRQASGIGLAANQVGYNGRVIVVETKNGAMSFINPEITRRSVEVEDGEEACLSVPGTTGTVKRHRQVSVKALDLDGQEQTYEAQGLFARVLQHEIDHLNGIVFIDRVENFTQEDLVRDGISV
ncbi:MAG: peptide deformylase [Parcubacteria group bacterium]|nr:peptide deformylase [Parcubacteria group bacterium]